jgi:hypothetical protein
MEKMWAGLFGVILSADKFELHSIHQG